MCCTWKYTDIYIYTYMYLLLVDSSVQFIYVRLHIWLRELGCTGNVIHWYSKQLYAMLHEQVYEQS